jgi:NDP-sugar pyrophosphorylase family protein
MQIDYALILSAGLGTRMGAIGKKLPKALWPVFFKSLIELQVDYCHDLGINKIFINTYFLSEEIKKYLNTSEKFKDIMLLHEDPLLDSGGAVHNMASQDSVNYRGNLLLVNVDQFIFFDNEHIKKALFALKNSRCVLFGITVSKEAKYNETVIQNEVLVEIRKNQEQGDYVTYSGLGILKLDGLIPANGPTKFFETVANYKKEKIQFVVPSKFEYWDFGTAEIYFESIKKIYSNLKGLKFGLFLDFLKRHNAFNGNENNFFNPELNSISLEGTKDFKKNSIVGNGIVQELL